MEPVVAEAVACPFRPGDRLAVWPDPEEVLRGRIAIDEVIAGAIAAAGGAEVETPRGAVRVRVGADGAALEGAGLGLAFPEAGRAQYQLEVVAAAPLRLRAVAVPLEREEGAVPPVLGAAEVLGEAARGRFRSLEAYRIGRAAWRLSLSAGFERLLCLPLLRDVDVLEHQVKAVLTVLRRHRARALLCDEVGLGKTVEAGMVLLELLVRRMARRVLILVPPSLVEQWRAELERKLGLDFATPDVLAFKAAGAEAWGRFDRVIASFHTAKREPHRAAILGLEYDLVIVDEAHHLRHRDTILWKFASALRKRFMLLLTATPVQNRLEDIFNLITVLKPGYLRTAASFRREFVGRAGVVPKNLDRLHEALGEVMVRNRRSQVAIRFTRRIARTIEVPLPPAEAAFYRDLGATVRASLREGAAAAAGPGAGAGPGRLALRVLQAEAGSSPAAAGATLAAIAAREGLPATVRERFGDLAQRAARLGPGAKAEAFLRLVRAAPGKLVVFTRFRATLDLLARTLAQASVPAALFHGGLARRERREALRRFEGEVPVLLSSDAGSEGTNLQFCHAVLNHDLPWNPMVLEQRVGRLSRIGQRHDVEVLNLVAAGTIEAHVLRLLEVKLRMFELVVGEIDMVLGNLEGEREFEERLLDLWAESEDDAAFAARLDRLGEDLLQAKEEYLRARTYDDALFGDRFVPEG